MWNTLGSPIVIVLIILLLLVGVAKFSGWSFSQVDTVQDKAELAFACKVNTQNPAEGAIDTNGDGYYDGKFTDKEGKEIDCSGYEPPFAVA